MVFRPAGASGFSVERARAARRSRCAGAGIERLLARHDIDNEDAMAYFEERLRRIGVIRALEAEGFEPGDEIEIARRRPSSSTPASQRLQRGPANKLQA